MKIADKPMPIFCLGLQRSGTTWLANMISNHPKVACVESKDHNGIHESIFFSHFAKEYGDLADSDNFQRFEKDFTASDYYLLTNLEKDWLRKKRPTSYAEAFSLIMNEIAFHHGADAWVEKSPHHTLLANEIIKDFPQGSFICITRSPSSFVWSRLWAFNRTPPRYPRRFFLIIKACAVNSLYKRSMIRFCKKHPNNTYMIQYKKLKENPLEEMRKIMCFLELDFYKDITKQRYLPNSSFKKNNKKLMGKIDKTLTIIFSVVFDIVPFSLLSFLERRKQKKTGVEWPSWCWKRHLRPSVDTAAHKGLK